MKRFLLLSVFTFGVLAGASSAHSSSELEAGFLNPPDSAKPETWWHWIDGNVSKEGITADLEAMKRVGIAKAHLFTLGQGFPQGPATFMSETWLDNVHFAAMEARRLGLKLGYHNSPGWSASGGPWVKPEDAMQMVVTSKIHPQGGEQFVGILPMPPFQEGYYRDIAVLAFPTPSRDLKIDNFETKALVHPKFEHGQLPDSKAVPPDAVIPKSRVIDLTSATSLEGRLTWEVPPGNWTILRIGHTPTGVKNHPAPVGGHGLECDKLNREAVEKYWLGGVEPVLDKLGDLVGQTLNDVLIDSYEVGCNNWTRGFDEEFRKRRGYDLVSFLPVFGGYYVESGEVTERFLWDFRRTIGDLFAENYYGYFKQKCHERGMLLSTEPYDGPFESLQVGGIADTVMGEFWMGNQNMEDSAKLAASIAHTHGKSVVGAEAFTALQDQWLTHPGSLKARGDWAFSTGINRFIFHTYTHQPWINQLPGMTFHWYGTHFDRNNTWWEQSRAWMSYLTRSQFLLQQGRAAADVLFFAGETSPNNGVNRSDLKALGYDYDAIGSDLIHKLTVRNNLICTPGGGEYRILVLPDTTWMTPALAEKVGELVNAGAAIVGPKPVKSPSLSGYPACDVKLSKLADSIWEQARVSSETKGRIVLPGRPIEALLREMNVPPDFKAPGAKGFDFIHRVVGSTDLYFVCNQTTEPQTVECFFRVSGRVPEIWNPETGDISHPALWRQENGQTVLTLDLEQSGSVFVVFDKPAAAGTDSIVQVDYSLHDPAGSTDNEPLVPNPRLFFADDKLMITSARAGDVAFKTESGVRQTVKIESVPNVIQISGPWDVEFSTALGVDQHARFEQLISWPDRAEESIKYFSGTAIYRKVFQFPAESLRPDCSFELELGQVHVIAEVRLNGKDLGILWKSPFHVKLGDALKPGNNELEIRVTNLWPNRLIGDAQYPEDTEWNDWTLKVWPDWVWARSGLKRPSTNRTTFTTWRHWRKDGALQPSGLLGPVMIRGYVTKSVNELRVGSTKAKS